MLEYQNKKTFFAKGYTPNWYEDVFVIKEVKTTGHLVLMICEEIIGTFYEKELQKTSQQGFRMEKVIKRKGNKIYLNWRVSDNSFSSWIDRKDLIEWNSLVKNESILS